uniref:protein FAM219A-like n=1 Tax=Ciona intestinalis TaxID=7719 RepID=UPI000EF4B1D3|nr:protein FAM219A-like [Ciona intestinalis]|eukprot:XP_026694804.1 protein FAM219A-like [Ciona intestinalis]
MSGILPNQAEDGAEENIPLKTNYTPSTLHKKLQKQRQKLQNKRAVLNEPKKTSLMPVTRLQIPNRGYQRIDDSPLVSLQSDSEDELFLSNKPTTARQVNKQLSRQLAKDGFQLDETPDDEALDLIPPNDFPEENIADAGNEDELFLSNKPTTARQVNKQLSRQLAKDGFQLDETPDDEALDLIPPNDFREGHYFACCNAYTIKCIVM